MAVTLDNLILQINNLLGDHDDTLYTRDQKTAMINEVMLDVVEETQCHIRRVYIQLKDRGREYEFPDDYMKAKNITLYELEGPLLINDNYQDMVHGGNDFNGVDALAEAWHAVPETHRNHRNRQSFFKELTSHDKFMVDPLFDAEKIDPIDFDNQEFVE